MVEHDQQYIVVCLSARREYLNIEALHKREEEEDAIAELEQEPEAEVVDRACTIEDIQLKPKQRPPLNKVVNDVNSILNYTDGSYERGRLGEDELVELMKLMFSKFHLLDMLLIYTLMTRLMVSNTLSNQS